MAVTPQRLAQLLGKPERVSYIKYAPGGIEVLIRRFEKVGTEEEQRAVQDALYTYQLTNPVAGGQPYPGEWRLVMVQDGKLRRPEDRQGVYQTLAKGEFILDPDGRIVEENCETRTKRIHYIDSATIPSLPVPAQGQTVRMGPIAYNREYGTYSTYIEIQETKHPPAVTHVSQKTVKFGVDTTVERGLTSPPTPPALSAGETYRATVNVKPDCTIDAQHSVETAPQLSAEQITLRGPNIQVQATVERNLTSEPTLPGSAAIGETIQASKDENPDGTWDKRESTENAIPLQQATIVRTKTKAGVTEDVSTGQRNVNEGNSVPQPTQTPSAGKVVRFERRKNPDGTWDKDERVDNRPPTIARQKRLTPTNGATDANTQSGATTEPHQTVAVPTQGTIRFVDVRENPDGSWEGTLRDETSSVLENYEKTATTKRSVEGTGEANKRDPMPTPTAPTPGKTIRFRRQKNEDGTWTWNEIIEDSTLAPLVAEVYEEAFCRSIATVTVTRNLSDKPNIATEKKPTAKGVVRSTRLTENPDGSWEKEVTDRVAPALTSTEKVKRAKGGIAVTIRRNLVTDPPEAGAPAQGVTVTQRIDENPDCSKDETLREETSPELVSTRKVFRADQIIASTRILNARAKANEDPPSAHDIKEVVNDDNMDGTSNTTLDLRTAIPITATVTYQSEERSVTATRMVNYSLDAIQNAATALNNKRANNVSVNESEFPGLFHATLTSAESRLGGGGGSTPPDAVPLDEYNYTITLKSGDKYNVTILLTRWRSQAKALVEPADNVYAPGLPTVGIFYEGRGVYRAVKVVRFVATPPPEEEP